MCGAGTVRGFRQPSAERSNNRGEQPGTKPLPSGAARYQRELEEEEHFWVQRAGGPASGRAPVRSQEPALARDGRVRQAAAVPGPEPEVLGVARN